MKNIATPRPGGAGGFFNHMWRSYERNLQKRPLLTQCFMTASLWGLGDALAQSMSADKASGDRTAVAGLYGFGIAGPSGHWWYSWLDMAAMRYFVPGSAPFVVSKVLADTLVFGPVHVCLYFAFTKLLEKGADPGDIVAKIKKDFIAAYVAEFALWTPVQLINFSFVPVKHHLLVVNAASIIDSCFLSWVGHHKDWVEALKSVVLGEPESDKQELSGCN